MMCMIRNLFFCVCVSFFILLLLLSAMMEPLYKSVKFLDAPLAMLMESSRVSANAKNKRIDVNSEERLNSFAMDYCSRGSFLNKFVFYSMKGLYKYNDTFIEYLAAYRVLNPINSNYFEKKHSSLDHVNQKKLEDRIVDCWSIILNS